MFQLQTIKFWPRFARFPCQISTRSGEFTRPGREPAPTRPCQKRDYKPHRPGRLGSETGQPGREKSPRAGGWPPIKGIARIRSGKCRACLVERGRSGWPDCVWRSRMLTKEDIRGVWCPVCDAAPGQKCYYMGKGASKKMRKGQSHHERMQEAQKFGPTDDAIIDDDDIVAAVFG